MIGACLHIPLHVLAARLQCALCCRVFYLETLKRQLPRVAEGGSLASVLEHCMYCGMSLGRVGLDFRGLLVPVFEQEVLRLFSTSVKVAALNL